MQSVIICLHSHLYCNRDIFLKYDNYCANTYFVRGTFDPKCNSNYDTWKDFVTFRFCLWFGQDNFLSVHGIDDYYVSFIKDRLKLLPKKIKIEHAVKYPMPGKHNKFIYLANIYEDSVDRNKAISVIKKIEQFISDNSKVCEDYLSKNPEPRNQIASLNKEDSSYISKRNEILITPRFLHYLLAKKILNSENFDQEDLEYIKNRVRKILDIKPKSSTNK